MRRFKFVINSIRHSGLKHYHNYNYNCNCNHNQKAFSTQTRSNIPSHAIATRREAEYRRYIQLTAALGVSSVFAIGYYFWDDFNSILSLLSADSISPQPSSSSSSNAATVDSNSHNSSNGNGNSNINGIKEVTLSRESVHALSSEMFTKFLVGVLPVGLLSAMTFLGWKRSWFRRDFRHRLNFSLNIVNNNSVKIRTLMEKNLSDVLNNNAALTMVRKAANKTSHQNPFVVLPAADAWFVNNCILNCVSEMCNEGFLRQDMGVPGVVSEPYIFGLTNEKSNLLRTSKLRVFIIKESTLKEIVDSKLKKQYELDQEKVTTSKSNSGLDIDIDNPTTQPTPNNSSKNNNNNTGNNQGVTVSGLKLEQHYHFSRWPALHAMADIYLRECGRGPILERVHLVV